jgi:hypothetical protein
MLKAITALFMGAFLAATAYAWNPAAFLDRQKNADDPELSREEYIVASADYTKSREGPLKTFSFTPVLVPAYSAVNDDLGETGCI